MNEMNLELFNERLADLIHEKRLNTVKLANLIGIDNSTIYKWKNEPSKPSADALVKLAKFFNVSTDYLMGLTDNNVPHY